MKGSTCNEELEMSDPVMDNFGNIPSEALKLQVRRLINTLHANAGSYDSDEVADALYALWRGVQLRAIEEMRQSPQAQSRNQDRAETAIDSLGAG
jgi:hypothetical protein